MLGILLSVPDEFANSTNSETFMMALTVISFVPSAAGPYVWYVNFTRIFRISPFLMSLFQVPSGSFSEAYALCEPANTTMAVKSDNSHLSDFCHPRNGME